MTPLKALGTVIIVFDGLKHLVKMHCMTLGCQAENLRISFYYSNDLLSNSNYCNFHKVKVEVAIKTSATRASGGSWINSIFLRSTSSSAILPLGNTTDKLMQSGVQLKYTCFTPTTERLIYPSMCRRRSNLGHGGQAVIRIISRSIRCKQNSLSSR